MNVFDFALRMEAESRDFYEKLAGTSGSEDLKRIFTLLADSEREHHDHLTLLQRGTAPEAAQSVALERARDQIRELKRTVEGTQPVKDAGASALRPLSYRKTGKTRSSGRRRVPF